LAECVIREQSVSVGRACRVIHLQRSLWYYRSSKDDGPIIDKLSSLAERFPTRGFDKYYAIIRNDGNIWARSRVLRVYREMNLSRRRKHKKRLPVRIREPLQKQWLPNQSYSMDFMSDSLVSGRKLRVLKVVDDCTRESLAVWCDYSITGQKVTEVLEQIIVERGKPYQIRVDNGPEFTGKVFSEWCRSHSIMVKHIQPGKPMQNAYIERLNRTYREDVLDAYLFESLEELRILSDEWQYSYNYLMPHQSLNNQTPAMANQTALPGALHLKHMTEQQQQIPDQQLNQQSNILNEATVNRLT
jgi:putative transposase